MTSAFPRPKHGVLGVAEIIASRVKTHANGSTVTFELRLCDGSGTRLRYQFGLNNPNPAVTHMGERRIADLCLACRVPVMTDTEQLHGCLVGVNYFINNREVLAVFAIAKPKDIDLHDRLNYLREKPWWKFWG